jgi:hypothetical protein
MQNRIQALPDGCVFGTRQFGTANLLFAGTHVPTHLLDVKRVYQPNAGKSITPIGLCRSKVEMSYSSKVEMSYWPGFANFLFPSSENDFRTARSCQGRAVVGRQSEPLTASTVLDYGRGGKGAAVQHYDTFKK